MLVLSLQLGLWIWSSSTHSPTIDEAAHLPAGISHWELGRFELYSVNPPLADMLAALPTRYTRPNMDWSSYQVHSHLRSEIAVGRDFLRANSCTALRHFVIGRLILCGFALLGMAVCWKYTKVAVPDGKPWFPATLFVLSPTFLAFAPVITPDVAAAALGCLAVHRFRLFLLDVSSTNTAWLGITTGLALATKFTWCLVFPLTAVVVLPVWRWVGNECRTVLRDVLHLCIASAIAIWVVNLTYGFDQTLTPLGEIEFVSSTFGGEELGESTGNRFRETAIGRVPVPLPKLYLQGIDVQKRDFERGYRSYLMGEWRHGGWWYYYLVAMAVKIPHATQILFLVATISLLRRTTTREQWREYLLLLTPPTLIIALVSSQTGFNHHMRYILPAFPFLYIFTARVWSLGKLWRRLTVVLLIWQAASVLWHSPHWMSYFNEGSGGPKNGHYWLVDSNIDWGQDLLGLREWQEDHPDIALRAALFTSIDPADLGLRFELPPPYLVDQPDVTDRHGQRGPQPGWYAISVCQLRGHHFWVPGGTGSGMRSEGHFTYFQMLEPLETIGHSIYIYNVTQEQADAVRAKLRQRASQ